MNIGVTSNARFTQALSGYVYDSLVSSTVAISDNEAYIPAMIDITNVLYVDMANVFHQTWSFRDKNGSAN